MQSKKKGLSVDEKRTKMMEFFYEKVRYVVDWIRIEISDSNYETNLINIR